MTQVRVIFRSTYEREGSEMLSMVLGDFVAEDVPQPGAQIFIGEEPEHEFIVQSVSRRALPSAVDSEELVRLEWAARN